MTPSIGSALTLARPPAGAGTVASEEIMEVLKLCVSVGAESCHLARIGKEA
jgi:hypothetical protein